MKDYIDKIYEKIFGTEIKDIDVEEKKEEDKEKEKIEMYFCSVCKKRIKDESVAGRCGFKNCKEVICEECWRRGERYCDEHKTERIEAKKIIDSIEKGDSIIKFVKNLTIEFMNFIERRFKEFGSIDFVPGIHMEKIKFKVKGSYGDFRILIFERKLFFRKKLIVTIIVKPLIVLSYDVKDEVKRILENLVIEKGKSIVIYVAAGGFLDKEVVKTFENFKSENVFTFLIDMENNVMYYNKSINYNKYVETWINSTKEPVFFHDVLKKIADVVNDRLIVSAEDLANNLGIDKKLALNMMENCKKLNKIKDTDTFILKF